MMNGIGTSIYIVYTCVLERKIDAYEDWSSIVLNEISGDKLVRLTHTNFEKK